MIKQIGLLGLCLCAAGLTACAKSEPNYQNFQSYNTISSYQPYNYRTTHRHVKPSRHMKNYAY